MSLNLEYSTKQKKRVNGLGKGAGLYFPRWGRRGEGEHPRWLSLRQAAHPCVVVIPGATS